MFGAKKRRDAELERQLLEIQLRDQRALTWLLTMGVISQILKRHRSD